MASATERSHPLQPFCRWQRHARRTRCSREEAPQARQDRPAGCCMTRKRTGPDKALRLRRHAAINEAVPLRREAESSPDGLGEVAIEQFTDNRRIAERPALERLLILVRDLPRLDRVCADLK